MEDGRCVVGTFAKQSSGSFRGCSLVTRFLRCVSGPMKDSQWGSSGNMPGCSGT